MRSHTNGPLCGFHVTPPSTDLRIAIDGLKPPTAKQTVLLGQLTPCRFSVVPEVLLDQFVPSVVTRTTPPAPTATHAEAEIQSIASKSVLTPDESALHDAAPLTVLLIVPAMPTAKHVFVSGQLTLSPWPSSVVAPCCSHVTPPSVVLKLAVGLRDTETQVAVVGQLIGPNQDFSSCGDSCDQPVPADADFAIKPKSPTVTHVAPVGQATP
ncbi:MAG: hypothetical protein E6J18_14785 [Chloroflexi bacterium]|nr:MAG: hypothetical protein E6J18_14785 [Chloroflexota bacterium]